MNLRYWAGYITPDVRENFEDLTAWATSWMDKAKQAEKTGMELIVLMVPKAEIIHSCDIPPDDTFIEPEIADQLFDVTFLRELLGEAEAQKSRYENTGCNQIS
jgi:hypothetical protein